MKRRFMIILIVAVLLTGLVGCGSKAQTNDSIAYDMDGMAEPAMAYPEEELDMDYAADMVMEETGYDEKSTTSDGVSSGMGSDSVSIPTDRKLIFRANYAIETTEFDADYDFILAELDKVGGYAQNAWVNGTKPVEYGDSGRYAEMSLRVPIKSYDAFITALEGVGNVLSKSQSTDDVTAQYFDTETRIRVLKTQLDRLEELKAKAEKTEDLIVLQREITDVIYQIESFEGQKRQLDDLIDYTTVSITLNEVNEITTITKGELGLGEKIAKGFANVSSAMVRFLEGLLILIVAGAPAWIPIGLIVWLIVWLVKRKSKKSTTKEKQVK